MVTVGRLSCACKGLAYVMIGAERVPSERRGIRHGSGVESHLPVTRHDQHSLWFLHCCSDLLDVPCNAFLLSQQRHWSAPMRQEQGRRRHEGGEE